MPNIDLLKHGVRVLERVDPRQFDLTYWKCGTTACAIGHFARDPVFQACGLKMRRMTGTHITEELRIFPRFGGRENYRAVEALFEIDEETAQHLFAPNCYPLQDFRNPKAVIARMRELIAKHEPTPQMEPEVRARELVHA